MAPKKIEEPERKPLIGRVGTNLKVGIVGVPNVGKSTFFNVLTKSQAAAENFPFCTIDPNEREPREDYVPSWPEPHRCVYPKANSYYAFHEDTNPFTRFASKCESRKYGNVQPHFESPRDPYRLRDPYCEIGARRKYFETEPTCFVILGKPDLNTAKLATVIADSWNCILVSPESLIKQEIERGTEKGRIIADILKMGECLGPEIIMRLIENRINERDVLHRGYVLEGLPLIPNETLDYSAYPNYSDDELGFESLTEKFLKFFDSFHRICSATDELQDNRDELSSDTREVSVSSEQKFRNRMCTVKPAHERFISSQVEDIFTTWPIKPSIIIYAVCPDADVVGKREHFRIDPLTGRTVDTTLAGVSRNIEMLFSQHRAENDMNISFELYRELMNEKRIFDENQRKYLLKRPSDNKWNVETQCKLYKNLAVPAIEKWVLLHNPQNVIRVDGRTPVSRMFQIVAARLRTLPVPRVILAKRFSAQAGVRFAGESAASLASIDEFESKSNEEAFQELLHRETVSPLYPWSLSSWNFLCPVELAKGRTVEGAARYAVRFMNKIFFLSSSEAADSFVENPRTFLFPFSPRPTCKIVVFGPDYSGKSDLCKTLAQTFKGMIINVKEVEKSGADIDWDVSYESLIRWTPKEKAGVVASKIKHIPKEEIDVEVWRDGGYIVDGMYPDVESWKTVVEDPEIVFEDVVFLFDEAPYEYLLSKWHKIHAIGNVSREELQGEYTERMSETGREDEGESSELLEYLRHIQQFELNWESIREMVADSCKNLIGCNISKIDDVSKYVIERIKDRYADKARIMTDEEKERGRDLAEYIAMTGDTENIEEEEEEEDEERTLETDVKEDTRRFGDTGRYCPVALLKYNVLWKGKEEFSTVFMDKVYLLSSAAALEEFLLSAQKSFLPLRKPLSTIPPLRMSIIGPLGSGKSALADAVSREYGLAHIDYFACFTEYMKNRGMPPVSRTDILTSPEDLLEDVDLPEDTDDEKYNSHATTVQTFIRSYWKTGGVLPRMMLQECLLTFFEGLYSCHGIVFDQFPSCSEDMEVALKKYATSEVVIELRCGKDEAFERTVPKLLESWQNKQEEKKRIEEARYADELKRYETDREIWIQRMLRASFKERNAEHDEEVAGNISEESSWHEMVEYEAEFTSEYLFDDYINSEEGALRRFELEESWVQEHPEPVLFTDWEDFEIARKRIVQDFEEAYEDDSRKLDGTRSSLENESIAYITVNAESSFQEVLSELRRILSPYVTRDASVLERMYTVDVETAETLLECGYYFQSSFGRSCPVQLYENKIPLQMFLPLEAEQEIHPVIHRQYVYFFAGKEARSMFLRNPFKYLEQDSCAPVIPFRLSIIGPPKCGKTTLARRFANKYGVKIVTRGAALRHALRYFSWSEFARLTESRLREGHTVQEECLSRAVEMYSIDPASSSQGFVLDGFPSNRQEYEQLTFLGLQPMLILDLKANLAFCSECLSREADKPKKPPSFSKRFLAHRYASWEIDRDDFRSWLRNFTQNVIEMDGTKSVWYVWTRADAEVCSRYINIKKYFRESDYDKVHSLKFMSVSPYEFKRRQSRFESYCPLCLFYENRTKTAGPPPDHRGMVQFRDHFYWICSGHINEFVENPEKYLPPVNTAFPPEERPRIVTETVDKEHSCWAKRLQIEGFCLVTYVDDLPDRKLIPGKPTIGALYKDKVYLFCRQECRDKFMSEFDKYARVDVKFLGTLPPIDMKTLPDLGFLEQTVAKLIVRAVNRVGAIRPKIPGLSPSITAAIYIGVYLKTHNASCALKETKIYETVGKRIHSRDRIIETATCTMKKKLNPFVNVPVYKDEDDQQRRSSGRTSDLSRIFLRTSNLITFRRTSPTQTLFDPGENSTD